jgi:hypothetical protein
MKKILLVLLAVLTVSFACAQDVILKKDGSEIKAKVIEITDQQIKYKDFDFQDGPTRNLNISEVFMVTYENGQKEVFNKISETQASAPIDGFALETEIGLNLTRTVFAGFAYNCHKYYGYGYFG